MKDNPDNEFVKSVVDIVELARTNFFLAMAAAKTEDDRAYIITGMWHAAAVIIASTRPPSQPEPDFRELVVTNFPRVFDGGADSERRLRETDCRAMSDFLRQTGRMQ